jgi:NAD(P)H-dependent FMN reductase
MRRRDVNEDTNSYSRYRWRPSARIIPRSENPQPQMHSYFRDRTLNGIPPFNQDEEQNPPIKVTELKGRIHEANAILFVTPGYICCVRCIEKCN